LQALVEMDFRNRELLVVRKQETRLNQTLALLERRQRLADLSATDSELTFLSLSEWLNTVALSESAFESARAAVQRLLPSVNKNSAWILPEKLWRDSGNSNREQLLQRHPAVLTSEAQWRVAQQKVSVVERENKAIPTLGVSAGRDDDESVIGVSFSMPLTVRNNFSARTRQQQSVALEAELIYRNERREIQIAMAAAWQKQQRLQARYGQWQRLTTKRFQHSEQLLENQWQAGDLSTPDYLRALQQLAGSQRSGLALEAAWKQAFVEWLATSGQLLDWLARQ